jgi:hypothetical protein
MENEVIRPLAPLQEKKRKTKLLSWGKNNISRKKRREIKSSHSVEGLFISSPFTWRLDWKGHN